MVRFTALTEFDVHVAKTQYPRLLIISARARMEGVEECNEGGAEASLVFADSPDEAVAFKKERGLTELMPEDFSIFGTEGQVWHEEVYILGDDGGGVVLYTELHER